MDTCPLGLREELRLNWNWLSRWTKILSVLFALQFCVQIINGLTGVALVRLLTKDQYALLTLSNSVVATINVATDMGLSVALINIGARVLEDKVLHRKLLFDALFIRRVFLVSIALFAAPVTFGLLLQNNASLISAAMLTILCLIISGVAASGAVYATVPRLYGQHKLIQVAELSTALCRFAGIALVFFASGMVAVVAMSITAIGQVIYLLRVQHVANAVLPKISNGVSDFRREIFATVRTLAPTAVFYGFQGHIATFLIGAFGNQEGVAELGAVMRFAIVFQVVSVVLTQVVAPAVARAHSASRLRRMLQICLLAYFAFSMAVLVAAMWLSDYALLVLGPGYYGLGAELTLAMASCSLSGLGVVVWSFVSARGWIRNLWIVIPLTVIVQAFLAFVLELNTLNGVILFGAISTLPSTLWLCLLGYSGFKQTVFEKLNHAD